MEQTPFCVFNWNQHDEKLCVMLTLFSLSLTGLLALHSFSFESICEANYFVAKYSFYLLFFCLYILSYTLADILGRCTCQEFRSVKGPRSKHNWKIIKYDRLGEER